MSNDDRILYQRGRVRLTGSEWYPGLQEYLATDKGVVLQVDASDSPHAALPFLLRVGPGTANLTPEEALEIYMALGNALADSGWKVQLDPVSPPDVTGPYDPTSDPDYSYAKGKAIESMRSPSPGPGGSLTAEAQRGPDVEQLADAELQAIAKPEQLYPTPSMVIARRELAWRRAIADGRPDHEPPDGPLDSPDPEAISQP